MARNNWTPKLLSEIITLSYGRGLPERFREKGLYPVYGSGGIVGYHKIWFVKGPGIIIGRKGSIGTIFYEKSNFFPIDTVFYVQVKARDVDFKFVYYLLGQLNLKLLNSDAAVPGLNRNTVYQIKCFIPPFFIQRTIADILSAYDDLIENNTRRIAILEEMAQMLYQEWFVKFRFPGRHEQVKMVESELGMIPEGWEVASFFDIAEIMSGGTPKTTEATYWNGDIPFYTPKDAPTSFFVTTTEKSITEVGLLSCASDLFPQNTVFITARGTVGKVALNAYDMSMNQSCYALKGRDGMSQLFIFLHIKNRIRQLKQTANGAVFETIIVDTFKWLQVVKPPLLLTDAFTTIIKPIFDQILNLVLRNNNLRRTHDILLPKLISGEIDVSLWVEGDVETQDRVASALDTADSYVSDSIARRVAEAGATEPIEQDTLGWHSLWE